jgi:hypothetical protein
LGWWCSLAFHVECWQQTPLNPSQDSKVQRAETWPSGVASGITLVTQTPVSKDEAIYALGTVLEWAGLKLVRVGEDGLKAVPAPENRR